MTLHECLSKYTSWLEEQIGYLEKKNNNLSYLFDKTANAGSANYNKYAYDIDTNYPTFFNGKKNGYAWCACFVFDGLLTCFGLENVRKMCGLPEKSLAAGVNFILDYFRKLGRVFSTPAVGDLVCFGTQHVEAVVSVSGNTFETIGGNTSGGTNTIVSNGGAVCRKKYTSIKSNYYFCRPNWSVVSEPESTSSVLKAGSQGPQVQKLQQNLIELGYTEIGVADGDFGNKTKNAVIRFQKENNLSADGIVGPATQGLIEQKLVELKQEKARYCISILFRELKLGDKGNDVKTIQLLLNAKNYPCGTADGHYGTKTENAVKLIQKAYNITESGILEQKTYQLLFGV